jgi:hypothetical protein
MDQLTSGLKSNFKSALKLTGLFPAAKRVWHNIIRARTAWAAGGRYRARRTMAALVGLKVRPKPLFKIEPQEL